MKPSATSLLNNRLNQYIVLAGAAAAAAPCAEAAVVYSGVVDILMPGNVGGLYLDMTTGVTGTGAFAGWDINPYYGGTSMYASAAGGGTNPLVSVIAAGGNVDINVPSGTLIPGTLLMENNLARATNGVAGSPGIMAIQFIDAGNT